MAVLTMMTKRALLLALVLVLAAPLAQAMPGGGRFMQARDGARQSGPQRQPNFQREEPQRFQREDPARFQRRDDGGGGEQQRQRLSPEERRQLRRDIHDAGRDIYPPRR